MIVIFFAVVFHVILYLVLSNRGQRSKDGLGIVKPDQDNTYNLNSVTYDSRNPMQTDEHLNKDNGRARRVFAREENERIA